MEIPHLEITGNSFKDDYFFNCTSTDRTGACFPFNRNKVTPESKWLNYPMPLEYISYKLRQTILNFSSTFLELWCIILCIRAGVSTILCVRTGENDPLIFLTGGSEPPPSFCPSRMLVACTVRSPRCFCELRVAHTPGKPEKSPIRAIAQACECMGTL